MGIPVRVNAPVIVGQNAEHFFPFGSGPVNQRVVGEKIPLAVLNFDAVPIKGMEDPARAQIFQIGVFPGRPASTGVNNSRKIKRNGPFRGKFLRRGT